MLFDCEREDSALGSDLERKSGFPVARSRCRRITIPACRLDKEKWHR